MLEFLQEQVRVIDEELKKLYVDRSRCSIETVGSYDIMIDRKKEARTKLLKEIEELKNNVSNNSNQSSSNKKTPKQLITKLISDGEIPEAIKELEAIGCDENTLVLILSRYNRNRKSYDSGTIALHEYEIELNKIGNSLLNLLNGL